MAQRRLFYTIPLQELGKTRRLLELFQANPFLQTYPRTVWLKAPLEEEGGSEPSAAAEHPAGLTSGSQPDACPEVKVLGMLANIQELTLDMYRDTAPDPEDQWRWSAISSELQESVRGLLDGASQTQIEALRLDRVRGFPTSVILSASRLKELDLAFSTSSSTEVMRQGARRNSALRLHKLSLKHDWSICIDLALHHPETLSQLRELDFSGDTAWTAGKNTLQALFNACADSLQSLWIDWHPDGSDTVEPILADRPLRALSSLTFVCRPVHLNYPEPSLVPRPEDSAVVQCLLHTLESLCTGAERLQTLTVYVEMVVWTPLERHTRWSNVFFKPLTPAVAAQWASIDTFLAQEHLTPALQSIKIVFCLEFDGFAQPEGDHVCTDAPAEGVSGPGCANLDLQQFPHAHIPHTARVPEETWVKVKDLMPKTSRRALVTFERQLEYCTY